MLQFKNYILQRDQICYKQQFPNRLFKTTIPAGPIFMYPVDWQIVTNIIRYMFTWTLKNKVCCGELRKEKLVLNLKVKMVK